jgi:flagellar hook-associated protein 3 FlgL
MRTTSANQFDNAILNLQRRQEQMAQAQNQLTSGKRVSIASDDPVAAAQAERAMSAIARNTANQRSLEASRSAMGLSEAALGEAIEMVQQARETLMAAGNGAYADVERKALVNKLKDIRGQLLSAANRTDGGGSYLFGGQGSSNTPPFIDTPNGVTFLGQGGDTQASSTDSLNLTLDGSRIWLEAKTGNGIFATSPQSSNSGNAWITSGSVTQPSQLPYPAASGVTPSSYSIVFTDTGNGVVYDVLEDGAAIVSGEPFKNGKSIAIDGRGMEVTINGSPADGDTFDITQSYNNLSIFDALDAAMATLSQTGISAATAQQAVNTGLTRIDSVWSNLQAARSAAGESLKRIDSLDDRNSSLKLSAETALSQAQDLDMVSAISKFKSMNTGYDAALQSYAMVQKLSLFDYLS